MIIVRMNEIEPSKVVKQSIEALSIKYNNIVYEKQNRGENVIVLSLGEPFFDVPLYSFEDLPKNKINHYSHSRGILDLRKKISKKYKEFSGLEINYETEILITAGSKIAIHMTLMSILNPGDEVIILEPAWVSYAEEIKLCYGNPIQIPYTKTVYDIKNYITNKTKMIIINNPHNPTGKIYSKEELVHVYELAKKHKFMILIDEAYSDYVYNNNEFFSLANLDPDKKYSVTINSLSKNMGISGWRIGYVITNPDLINQILKINQHLITCPSTILEYYVNQYFDKMLDVAKPQILELLDKRKTLTDYMDEISLNYLPGKSTFYFFISIQKSNLSSDEFCTKLLYEKNISVVPGIGYGISCDNFIRVSIGSEKIDDIKKGLNEIRDLILKTSSH